MRSSWLVGSLILFSAAALAQSDVPAIRFDSVPDPLTLPDNLYFGEVTGVAVNSKGHVFVLSRGNTTGPAYAAAAAQLLEFDQNGKYVREIGHNLYAWSFGHSVRVDPHGNVWVTDKGSDMVIEFNPKGRVMMVFGRKQEASDEDTGPLKHPKPPLPPEPGRFRQVTDVTWDPAGNMYVSDGYINSRIAKADKNGTWLASFGTPGKNPGEFNTPHNIAADAQGNLYVADRGNRRLQVLDGNGKFLREIRNRRAGGARCGAGDRRGAGRCEARSRRLAVDDGTGRAVDGVHHTAAAPGAVHVRCVSGTHLQALAYSKVLGVLGESGKQLKQFGWVHEIACPSENVLWVGELLNWRMQKLILHP